MVSSDGASADAAQWLDQYGDFLFRFAMARVRDPEAAEDLVQETMIAAIRAQDRFTGQSSFRTWLVGILKHKILDHFRAQSRTVLAADLASPDLKKDPEEAFFDQAGQWRFAPRAWSRLPDEVVEQKDFQRVLSQCLEQMPETMARLFVLRDVEGMDSDEIAQMMDITPSNLYTTLHRARFRLRRCLEQNWFATETRP